MTGGARGNDSAGNQAQLEVTGRYQGTTPRGRARLRTSLGRFRGSDVAWVVAVGSDAIMQVAGDLAAGRRDAPPAGHDGRPSTSDTFQAMLGPYDSGVVAVAQGNLQVR